MYGKYADRHVNNVLEIWKKGWRHTDRWKPEKNGDENEDDFFDCLKKILIVSEHLEIYVMTNATLVDKSSLVIFTEYDILSIHLILNINMSPLSYKIALISER